MAKNRASAQNSRNKKKHEKEELEQQVKLLHQTNNVLTESIAVLTDKCAAARLSAPLLRKQKEDLQMQIFQLRSETPAQRSTIPDVLVDLPSIPIPNMDSDMVSSPPRLPIQPEGSTVKQEQSGFTMGVRYPMPAAGMANMSFLEPCIPFACAAPLVPMAQESISANGIQPAPDAWTTPLPAELAVPCLPPQVKEELAMLKRTNRIPDTPISRTLPPAKWKKLDRMLKNRVSAQKSRDKKARHIACLRQQVKLLEFKNHTLIKCADLLLKQWEETQELPKEIQNLHNDKAMLELRKMELQHQIPMPQDDPRPADGNIMTDKLKSVPISPKVPLQNPFDV